MIKFPTFVEYTNYGNTLQDQGEPKEAIKYYKKALELSPNHPVILQNLGTVLHSLGRLDEAEEAFKEAIKIPSAPLHEAHYHYNLGMVYLQKGQLLKVISCLEKVIELNPKFADACNTLFLVKRQICDWRGIGEIEKRLDKIKYNGPLSSVIRHEDARINFKAAKAWSEDFKKRFSEVNYAFNKVVRKEEKKIRIGYLSNDLQDHPVGQMVASMFGHHDRSRFEVWIYSGGKDDGSMFRKMIKEGADKFFDIQNIKNTQVSDIIFAHKIDILVDLMGYTKANLMEVCVRHPAPIQVTWLGFPGTSGAGFFDYVIVDKTVVPPKDAKFYSEKLMYLPRCYQVNNNCIQISKKGFVRADFNLPKKGIIFASFNQPYKIEPVMWSVWMKILSRVPGSVLWLWEKDKEAKVNLQREAKMAGIDPKRLVFSGRLPKKEHLKRIGLADLGLDTRIYGGHTTTSDFLWAGVPAITKLGTHFASRVCASILLEAGLPELVCKSLEEYEEKAVDLALNPDKLNKLKKKITQERLKKSLFDTKGFVKDLERAYIKMWEKWIKQLLVK